MNSSQTHAPGQRNSLFPLVLVALGTAMSSGCDAQQKASESQVKAAESTDEVKALLERVKKNLRFVEGGTFQMGDFGPLHSPEKLYYSSRTDNKPLHKVTLDSFYMSAYKTTYEDHDVYSRATGKPLVAQDELTKDLYRQPLAGAGLNWFQARAYCQWLGQQLKLPMDLPTEAQWEYAARNRGQFFLYATDNGKVDDGRNVWNYDQRVAYEGKVGTAVSHPSLPPLGQFPPTPLGLYDMMTDGYEWTLDWYDENYYKVSPVLNPTGPNKGEMKVLRSFRGASGLGISYGDGMAITRHKRLPDPPGYDRLKGRPDPSKNMVNDTMARCVANVKTSPLP
ncbi:formylglycine-generating enzyme family protein [Ideonella sp.]|jgi:formylglycine-generating enzyme required for sulfatase activity|uniref:formylglycine-generating enzyme family protein n=1 Tax=Ideonella sp. TaxID=1929293 RepID=UPI0037BF6A27